MSDTAAGDEAGSTLQAPDVHRVMRRAVLVPLVAVGLLCGLLGLEVAGLARDYDRVIHTEQVLSEIHQTQRLLIDHETALRAHMLIADTAFLAPYRAAEQRLPEVLDILQAQVVDNREQVGRIGELRALYADWKASADRAIGEPAVCRLDDRDATLTAMRDRKAVMDTIRGIVQSMVEAERALLLTRGARTLWTTRLVFISGIVLGLALIVSLVIVFRRWLRVIERSYRQALSNRAASEEREREARTVAEALAVEIQAESRALELRYRALREELEALRRQV